MSFGDLFYGGSGELPYGGTTIPTAGVISQPLQTPTFSSSALSLGLGRKEMIRIAGIGGGGGGGTGDDVDSLGRKKDDENDSRSGSDNVEGVSGDDLEQENPRKKKKRHHRHTPHQIQELEALFKECPHPDEKQRTELSKRLSLECRQVKFWFQNRRTQMKTQIDRHENSILRHENDKLRAENLNIRDAMRNPICNNCGSPAMLGEVSLEEQHLRIENARLKEELDRVCALNGKFLGRPVSSLAAPIHSSLDLAVVPDFIPRVPVISPPSDKATDAVDRSMFVELALAAMDELVKMAQMDYPLWIPSIDGGKEVLNEEEYLQLFPRCIGAKPAGYASEATRETGMVIINSLALVGTLMDATQWADMFPCMIARTATTDILSSGVGGSRNGVLQLMHAELQVLSPLVPIREVNFLRFCKQHADGVWAVVDVSVGGTNNHGCCRRLPSGCVVQDMPNGYSKVTWVEHSEYDEAAVHQLYRPLLSSGSGLGAQRWIATLQRQCECLAILMSTSVIKQENTVTTGITAGGRRSMLKLAQRMTNNFCAGVCASSTYKWSALRAGGIGEDVRVMTRQSIDDPGEPPGVVLSAATSVWLPVAPHRLFDFLRDEGLRSEWDILSNGGPMQEMAHIAKGQDHGNAVSLLRAGAVSADQSSILILQETCTDASGSVVVYAPVDVSAMHLVMNGGDSAYVALLPSGFSIVPDGGRSAVSAPAGSLLTVAFQILVNSLPSAKLTVESVETVNNLISCTVQKIKAALCCEN